jgi:nitrite reductase (NADH) small subunit
MNLTAQAQSISVAALEEVPENGRLTVEAFGTTIAIFNVDGRLFAIDNHCPHQGGPLCHGQISGAMLPSKPYEYLYGRPNSVLSCPWHGWQFDLETGETLFDPHVRVPIYPVRVMDGQIFLSEPAESLHAHD